MTSVGPDQHMREAQKDPQKNQSKSHHKHFKCSERQDKASNTPVAKAGMTEKCCSDDNDTVCVMSKCYDEVEKIFEIIKYFFIIYFLMCIFIY